MLLRQKSTRKFARRTRTDELITCFSLNSLSWVLKKHNTVVFLNFNAKKSLESDVISKDYCFFFMSCAFIRHQVCISCEKNHRSSQPESNNTNIRVLTTNKLETNHRLMILQLTMGYFHYPVVAL